MSLSIQTNTASLAAQENLRVNSNFQSQTIQRLTSGYRINSAGDDAAGLAVANKFRNDIAELTQGVRNANDGLSQLQIADGGLSNIANMLDRLKTLATESGSSTFTGDRTTLNNEYQTLLGEIDRQATNINLNTGGSSAVKQQIYIGGASSANSNAMVTVDLSAGAVDTKGLSLNGSSIIGGGVGFASDTQRLDDSSANFMNGTGNSTFTFNYVDASGTLQSQTATVNAKAGGYSGSDAVAAVNSALTAAGITGITASIGANGHLQFGGDVAFRVAYSVNTFTPAANSNSQALVNGAATSSVFNTGVYTLDADFTNMTAGTPATIDQQLTFSVGGKSYVATVAKTTANATAAANAINATTGLNAAGVYAIVDGSKVLLTSSKAFTVANTTATDDGGMFASSATPAGVGDQTVAGPVTSTTATGNATAAINAIASAISHLGQVQGRVGAGENQLNYAISLAQSQITNFSSAQSQIRDADVAAEAANLTKAQVLQQASIAAMAQANSAPQAVLSLLKG